MMSWPSRIAASVCAASISGLRSSGISAASAGPGGALNRSLIPISLDLDFLFNRQHGDRLELRQSLLSDALKISDAPEKPIRHARELCVALLPDPRHGHLLGF